MNTDRARQRETMRRAHKHYRRMSVAHPDWEFRQSLRIELNRARSIPALMSRIATQIASLKK